MRSDRRNLIAQWAFDTRSILGRFHLWLEDVEETWVKGGERADFSFVGPAIEKGFIMTAAVTALGTRVFGRYADGLCLDDMDLNRVKKDADAVSAYAMSEGLWYLTRSLPENHAVMVSLGEGLMPKAGETPEMGANPNLGFGRVYARPQVAKFLDRCVRRLINDPNYEWDEFWHEIGAAGITVWGAAIDTLENTSRFAKGSETGPMSVLHLFDQPLAVSRPYEGYVGTLALPRQVVAEAEARSILINYLTPRSLVMDAIRRTYPGIRSENVHVWTLGGETRELRLGDLWSQWTEEGAHLVEEDWELPSGMGAFRESGTYAPTFLIGAREDDAGETHVFLLDGYAASAEAIQAASLDPVLDTTTSMCTFSSRFQVSTSRERHVMQLDHEAPDFGDRLAETLGCEVDPGEIEEYRWILQNAREAGMPLDRPTVTIDDFIPLKKWRVLAVLSYMLPDPYSGAPGVEDLGDGRYKVTTRAATKYGILDVTMTLRLMEKTFDESRLVFSPLLQRFFSGADYESRAVKISDSGRIRNELQTILYDALDHFGENGIRVHFDRIDNSVVPEDQKECIREVLTWYKANHPMWFEWLDLR